MPTCSISGNSPQKASHANASRIALAANQPTASTKRSVEIENHTRRHAVLLKALGKDVSHGAIKRESGRLAMRSETYRTAPVKEQTGLISCL
ncbi:hypothetical protein, partial [Sagittula marina]|uniref:hypothetical protein n=1 Tax=Sagittula marina TaxID=943940 RepID=UPI001C85174E